MELLYVGKTKNVYKLSDGNLLLEFKDDVTGTDGVFDPGANTVGLTLEGSGLSALKLTTHFFEIFKEKNIPTHFVSSDFSNKTMTVLPAEQFGKGIEIICRFKAVGSFLRRYAMYAKEGQPLDFFVEFTLKDDERGDPVISEDGLFMLNIMSREEYRTLVDLTKKISKIVFDELEKHGLELYDIKLEFGKNPKNGEIMLIDEISGGNMRVYENGKYVEPLSIEKKFLN
ncbi:MAG: phosphoribosylaminoimidazolesuccinocarboxamide synthase [Methanosarcinaceae archaeon]|nr:phosphoribosylaminoimidazolesuccinocarboxamide synthase [Methanosarcinaceae archaeon]